MKCSAFEAQNRALFEYGTPCLVGGLHVDTGATMTIENCTVSGHSSEGLYNKSASVTVRNSIFYDNADDIGGTVVPSMANNCIGDGDNAGVNGNFSGDPKWELPEFYLATGSPCIDKGTNETWVLDAVDMEWLKRRQGSFVDMGAYEAPSAGTMLVIK